MSYVVYHLTSSQLIKTFATESGAKRCKARMNLNAKSNQYEYTTLEIYDKEINKKIKVKSLMTGEEVEIYSNTPWNCRPDSESYWSS